MENKFTVDYDKKTVELHYEGEVFNFDLTKGDEEDFWGSFTDKNEVTRDMNFSQENENQKPFVSVYGLIYNEEEDNYSTNTNDQTEIETYEQIGNPLNYFQV